MTVRPPVRIGISSCLLGEAVRYDGGHKRDRILVQTLGPLVEWVSVCPEAELGLGTPREPIRLVRDAREADGVRLVTVKTGIDLTQRMRRFARQRVRALANENLSGYILKNDSPSCGMERVAVWRREDARERTGRGLFAAELKTAVSRTCRSRRKAGSTTRSSGRISSYAYLSTGRCAQGADAPQSCLTRPLEVE